MSPAVRQSTARMPVIHLAEQWSGYCQRYALSTRQVYARTMRRFLAYAEPKTLRDITPIAIQTYLNSLLAGYCPKTANLHLVCLKSFFRWLDETYNYPNLTRKIRRFKAVDHEARCLSDEEYRKLMVTLKGRDFHLVRFLCNTGLRASELTGLAPTNINGKWLIVHGKGNKTRHVPLNDAAAESLRFIMNFSKKRYASYLICLRAARKAGIAPFSPHSCRHFFATSLLSRGAPIQKVSKILGHSSVLITEKIYWHFRHTDLAGLTDCLE